MAIAYTSEALVHGAYQLLFTVNIVLAVFYMGWLISENGTFRALKGILVVFYVRFGGKGEPTVTWEGAFSSYPHGYATTSNDYSTRKEIATSYRYVC